MPDRSHLRGVSFKVKGDASEGKALQELFESREDLKYQALYELWRDGARTSDYATGSHVSSINGEGEEV